MSFSVDMSQLTGLGEQLRQFGAEVHEHVALDGAAAMANVVYSRARLLAPVSEHAHIFYGRNSKRTGVTYTFQPGNLQRAIYRAFSPEKSGATRKEYRISWNHYKAPYGHMVEFGTSTAAAHPFLGPSLSSLPEAFAAAKVEMGASLLALQRSRG
ncbi:hypothetical protein [Duganella sp.]|uniref:hypothetical protein n=1 Tax=Duganella sp. TaxID=1904440 RepID=UPI0031D1ED82